MTYDVLIVGGGPIGIASAIEAKKKNLSYIIIEKGALVNSLYNYPDKMTFFSTSEKLELDEIPFVSNNNKPTKQEALEYYRRIVDYKQIHINLFEKVEKVTKNKSFFRISTSKADYQAKNIVISTGFYDIPNHLNIPGEELDKVSHYYKDPHYYATQKLVVVGASNSSVDAALETYRKGADVTMIVRGEQVGERVKYWVRPDVLNRIKEGSIKAYFNSELTEVGQDYVKFKDEQGHVQEIENDFVLVLTGYRPNFEFLKMIGVALSDDGLSIPAYNQQTMETNLKGVYLAGVICGGMETHKWFIENSRIHAKMIMENINS
ncbi:bacillithiol system oxidoreductase, YpdA family [Psychroflexus torquis ATCC 700755]|uniref:Bacillithiol system oxidoreductase, YpdA family n=1 Tax=Psychroflexus torquis (strain ATCC 700755 / CIP 106069 / ACAM 623) TaxID=313595 RepID=K4IHD4_PSYTT|nr:YpdA family putative bacillithiol disulfide reductase [Psychroflexus torquis]AFU69774.1 bacillithiol system oxidoreductase, YpdA family [Psychroflexus torquis ATCC 700755]